MLANGKEITGSLSNCGVDKLWYCVIVVPSPNYCFPSPLPFFQVKPHGSGEKTKHVVLFLGKSVPSGVS